MRYIFSSSLFFKYSIDQNYLLKFSSIQSNNKVSFKTFTFFSHVKREFFSSSKLPPEYYTMFLWNVRNTIMKLKPATLLKKISNLFISFIFSAIFGQHLSVATFIIWVCKRKKNSVEKDFSCGICVCKKGKNTDETWQEKDLSKAIHDHGKATLFESIYKVEKVGRSDWKCKSSVFYFLFEL